MRRTKTFHVKHTELRYASVLAHSHRGRLSWRSSIGFGERVGVGKLAVTGQRRTGSADDPHRAVDGGIARPATQ